MSFLLEYACISNTGKCRSNNQDNFFCVDTFLYSDNNGTKEIIHDTIDVNTRRAFCVFDGMGGEYNGEMASYLASKRASDYFTSDKSFRNTINDLLAFCNTANNDICKYAKDNSIPSMGTTGAILLFDKNGINLCNIGDSKIYRFSKGGLEQLSEDHLGIAAYGLKPPLSQNLGIPEDELIIEPYTASGCYNVGDKYLICSDGLTDMVANDVIADILKSESTAKAAKALVDEALNNGGKDNITLIVIEIQKSKSFIKRLFGKRG